MLAEEERKTTGPKYPEDLPEDLLVHIFHFLGDTRLGTLDSKDLVRTDSVCKSWRRTHGYRAMTLSEVAAEMLCRSLRISMLPITHLMMPPRKHSGVSQKQIPSSWKQKLSSIRFCSPSCWCNFCSCSQSPPSPVKRQSSQSSAAEKRLPAKPPPVQKESVTVPPAAAEEGKGGLCECCGGCRWPTELGAVTMQPSKRSEESSKPRHVHRLQVPWDVFDPESTLTTLFCYKDGWEKKPLWLSAPFWLDQLEWRVMCFPKGVPSGPDGCISLFLECATLCRCACHMKDGGEHHFHTGVPHPEHAGLPSSEYESISVGFSLGIVRPEELNADTREHSTIKEATHCYRFGVPVDSGWRSMVSLEELAKCRQTSPVDAINVEVTLRVDKKVVAKPGKSTCK